MFPAPVCLAPAMCWAQTNKNESEIISAIQETLYYLMMYIWENTANTYIYFSKHWGEHFQSTVLYGEKMKKTSSFSDKLDNRKDAVKNPGKLVVATTSKE